MSGTAEITYLAGKVWKRTLPVFTGPPDPGAPSLKRMLLPQGELAQVHDSEEGMHYMAVIELREGSARGNHFHKVKRELVYLLSGACSLILETVDSKHREVAQLSAGELVFIPPGVAHTLQVTSGGQAIEFSPERFNPADTYRYSLGV